MSALAVPTSSAPDLIDPVIGYRQWSVCQSRLYSPFHGELWEDVELHASCVLGTHDAVDVPAAHCTCGVYAYYDPPPRSAATTRWLVTGAVVIWRRGPADSTTATDAFAVAISNGHGANQWLVHRPSL